MCGIVGVIDRSSSQMHSTITSMVQQISHRGPDATGVWVKDCAALGNARLAIVDLSTSENQPMVMEGKTLVFNGEIYNYKDIRRELESLGRRFQTNSDTEVVLQAFLEWDVESFSHLNGMWAIAIYDSIADSLVLSRDRFGVKPLYWTRFSQGFAFGSEMKSLLGFISKKTLNTTYFGNAIFGNRADEGANSPIEEIFQVSPGSYLTVDKVFQITETIWWQIKETNEPTGDFNSLSSFKNTFEDAVRIRIPSDVRYGFSLSGGLDSTAVFSCAARNAFFNNSPSGIFNLAYRGGGMDESPIAKETAALHNQELEIFSADPEKLFEKIGEVVWSQEGIGWNPSILAYDFYYERLRENGIKVIIEGHGADELYGGYPGMISEYLARKRYFTKPIWTLETLKMLNQSGNPEVGELPSSSMFRIYLNYLRAYGSVNFRKNSPVRMPADGLFSKELITLNRDLSDINPYSRDSFKSVTYRHTFQQTLPQVLRVFDRASMAHGVESRAPFLDYRLFELAMNSNDKLLVSKKYTKPIIREALSEFIPSGILKEQRKRGFGAPLNKILEAKSTAKYLLSNEMVSIFRQADYINSEKVINLLKQNKSTYSATEIKEIWQATTFAIWQDKFL
jgi:asparagine synthase (glutamine-hydrolysing)